MQLINPDAGLGTRMRPHTYSKPKPLVPVAGKPSIAHILDAMAGLPIDRVVLITGARGEMLLDYVQAHYPYEAVMVEQKVPNGQSPAVALTEPFITPGSDVFVVFSDTLFVADFSVLLHLDDADGAGFVKEVPDPSRFGIAVPDAQGYIRRMVEKPQTPESNLAVVGLYYFKDSRRLFSAIHKQIERNITLKNEFFLADAIQIMIDHGARLRVFPVTVWEDTGTIAATLHTNRYFLRHLAEGQDRTPYLQGSSLIVPPVYVDPTATLEQSVIGPYASIGPDATVTDSVVRDSILDSKAHVHRSTLSGSIIGERARVEGGFTALNVGDDSSLTLGGLTGEIDERFT
jgi:glucose-1-phosphate thymidylyltransferase